MTRSAILVLVTLASVACAGRTAKVRTPDARIDHLVYAVPDLDQAMKSIEARTGVRPVYGGAHPGRGTHNALLSLGEGAYLELIALQPGAPPARENEDLRALREPALVAWAVAVDRSEDAISALREAGFKPSVAQAGSRVTPAGTTLAWHVFGLEDGIAGAPFFIDWSDGTAHPSGTSPQGCVLVALTVRVPDAARLVKLVEVLGVPVEVHETAAGSYSAELRCPAGPVSLP